jgi:hypothetical protein
MCVIAYKRTFLKYDDKGDMDYGYTPHFIRYEGVYMFGGVHGSSSSN